MANMKVRDLMTESVKTVGPNDTLATVYDLMDAEHFRHLPVSDDDGRLVGILSSQDLFRARAGSRELPLSAQREILGSMKVDEIMNTAPETVEPGADLRDAAETLLEYKLGCLPVIEGDSLVGIITEADFVRHVLESSVV